MAAVMAMAVAMMPVMVADLLDLGACNVVLIRKRGLCDGVRLGLRAIHQILMRRQHRSSGRGSCRGGDGPSAGSKAERKSQEFTTFHFLFLLVRARMQRGKYLAETMNVV